MRIHIETRTFKVYGKPGIYDLAAFAKKLPGGKQFKKLKGVIRRLSSSGSAVEDLEMAAKYLNAARVVEGAARSLGRAPGKVEIDTIAALTSWAIVIYSRATGTSSKSRDPQNIIEHLDNAERRMHGVLRGLRDDALAHFGSGPNAAQPWSKDAVILVTRPNDEVALYTPVFRTGFRGDVSLAAEHLVGRAIAIVTQYHQQQKADFWSEYEALVPEHPWIVDTLQACPWDSTSFYEEQRADEFTTGMMSGQNYAGEPVYRDKRPYNIHEAEPARR